MRPMSLNIGFLTSSNDLEDQTNKSQKLTQKQLSKPKTVPLLSFSLPEIIP